MTFTLLYHIPYINLVIKCTQLYDIHVMVLDFRGCISAIWICRIHLFDIHCLVSDYLGLSSSIFDVVIQRMQLCYIHSSWYLLVSLGCIYIFWLCRVHNCMIFTTWYLIILVLLSIFRYLIILRTQVCMIYADWDMNNE